MAEISKIQWLDLFNENPECAKTMLEYAREELYSSYANKEEIEKNDELNECFETVKKRFSLEGHDILDVFFVEKEDSHEEQQDQKEEQYDFRKEIFEALHRFQISKLLMKDSTSIGTQSYGFVKFLIRNKESNDFKDLSVKYYDEYINITKSKKEVISLEKNSSDFLENIWEKFEERKEDFCKNYDIKPLKNEIDSQIEINLENDPYEKDHRDIYYNEIFNDSFWDELKYAGRFFTYCNDVGYDTTTTISKVLSDLSESWIIDQGDDFREGPSPLGEPDDDIKPYVESLRKDKNVILQGAPGVGKTYTAQLIMDYFKNRDSSRVKFVTFHQSMGYEDFVEGIKAKTTNGAIEYSTEDGVFKEFCREAWKRPDEEFLMVIDEINRGNISRIFGELISLIEKDKRSGGSSPLSATLPYTKDEFTVPSNIYILGTMNTTDRSVGGIDYALRRRFTFRTIKAEKNKLNTWPQESNKLFEDVENIINNHKAQDISNVDDIMVGHSYFMTNDILDAWKNKIRPLLEEYINDGILKNSARGKIEELNKLLDPRETNTNE